MNQATTSSFGEFVGHLSRVQTNVKVIVLSEQESELLVEGYIRQTPKTYFQRSDSNIELVFY